MRSNIEIATSVPSSFDLLVPTQVVTGTIAPSRHFKRHLCGRYEAGPLPGTLNEALPNRLYLIVPRYMKRHTRSHRLSKFLTYSSPASLATSENLMPFDFKNAFIYSKFLATGHAGAIARPGCNGSPRPQTCAMHETSMLSRQWS